MVDSSTFHTGFYVDIWIFSYCHFSELPSDDILAVKSGVHSLTPGENDVMPVQTSLINSESRLYSKIFKKTPCKSRR